MLKIIILLIDKPVYDKDKKIVTREFKYLGIYFSNNLGCEKKVIPLNRKLRI